MKPFTLMLWLGLVVSVGPALVAEMEPERLAGNVYLFDKTADNVVAVVGEDGVLLVDSTDQAETAEQLQAAIAKVSDKPVRWLVNTHWHYDHVGGNAFFGGAKVTIIAHELMRQRAAVLPGVRGGAPLSGVALPVVLVSDRLKLQVNGEEVVLLHPLCGPAHTDGDLVVFFRKANVVAMGDIYIEGTYPFIDTDSGGWIGGVIDACREVLTQINGQTRVVPGHGTMSGKQELTAYVAMLDDVRGKVTALIRAGKSLADVQAARPTASYDAVWGKKSVTPAKFTEVVYNGLVKHGVGSQK